MLRVTVVSSLLALAIAYGADIARTQEFLHSEDQVTAEQVSDKGVFPVPTTSRCIVIMICQYMIVYLALAICRTYHEFSGTETSKIYEALKAAAQTLTYGPMLCVLFIACRMRVEFLSGGTDQPQMWVQRCMYGVTFAVLASTLMVFLIPLLSEKSVTVGPGGAPARQANDDGEHSPMVFMAMTIFRYLILLGLYIGLAGIIVGINIYLPPGATDVNKLPPPAPAVHCTMILAVVFFSTQLVIAFCRTYEEMYEEGFPTLESIMNEAANTVEFGPMLAILFLCARMRALQHDSQPQAWAQDCMYASTVAVCITTGLAIVIPVAVGGKMETDETTREKRFTTPEGSSKALVIGLNVLRWLCMIGFYGGAFGVIYSIYTFKAPEGQKTLPVSPAAHCVANLVCQFFFVYGAMTVMLSISSVSGIQMEKSKLFAALDAAKATLRFAPMLAILFVTTRMYALLITNKKGAPQAWVQDGMFMATWSLLISFIFCLCSGLLLSGSTTDSEGNAKVENGNKWLALGLTVVRYLAMVLLYGGIVCVIAGLFVMTPENANGKGSLPVVSDIINATPFGGPPPSAADAGGSNGVPTPPDASSTRAHGFFF